jgi:hypothetical protein
VKKFWTGRDIILEHGPLMLVGALALVTGVILFCTGLLGRSDDANLFRKPGPAHLRGSRNPFAPRRKNCRRSAWRSSLRRFARSCSITAVWFCFHPEDQQFADAARDSGLALEDFILAFWLHRIPYDAGKLTPEEYWREVLTSTGGEFDPARVPIMIQHEISFWLRIDQRILDWSDQLRAKGIRTGFSPTCRRRWACICADTRVAWNISITQRFRSKPAA